MVNKLEYSLENETKGFEWRVHLFEKERRY